MYIYIYIYIYVHITLKPFYILLGKGKTVQNQQNIQTLFTFEYLFTLFYIIIFLYIYILRMSTFILHQVAAQLLSTHNC